MSQRNTKRTSRPILCDITLLLHSSENIILICLFFSLFAISTVHSKIRENLHEIKKKVLSKILSNPIFGCHWSFQFDNIFQSALESYRYFFIGHFYCPLQDFSSNLLGDQFHSEWLGKN